MRFWGRPVRSRGAAPGVPAEYRRMDRTIGVGQLRAQTCTYIQMVAGGETLRVLRRGCLVALIRPLSLAADDARDAEILPPDLTPVNLSSFRTQAGRHLDHVSTGTRLCVVHNGRPLAEVTQPPDNSRLPAATGS